MIRIRVARSKASEAFDGRGGEGGVSVEREMPQKNTLIGRRLLQQQSDATLIGSSLVLL